MARAVAECVESRVLLTTVVGADADTYIYENTPTTNYGTATTLEIKKSSGTHEREAYIRFPLTAVPSIDTATLRLFGRVQPNGMDSSNVTIEAYASDDTTWSQTTPTWNNPLTIDTTVITSEVIGYNSGTDKWWEFDVSGFLAEQKANGATAVTFVLTGETNTDPRVAFRSREATNNKPELVLTPEADFVQNPNGLVVMEAEDFSGKLSQSGKNWTLVTSPSGYSGTGAMQALTDSGLGPITAANAIAQSPRMDFAVYFHKTGTHYVHVRGHGPSGDSDSVHVGINGTLPSGADNIRLYSTSGYDWEDTADSARLTVDIPSAGVHTISVWMREDGSVVDKITIEDTSTYVPSAAAPVITTAAAASPSTVTSTTTTLSVAATDDGGSGNLTYNWMPVGTPPGYVEFSTDNGTNSGNSVTARFEAAGTYQLKVVVSDGEQYSESSVNVTVSQTLSSVKIAPASLVMRYDDDPEHLTAIGFDQFGNQMTLTDVDWTLVQGGGGTNDIDGDTTEYTPGFGAGEVHIKAESGGLEDTAELMVGQIVGTVFADADGDGAQETNEIGLEGWSVYFDVNANEEYDSGEPLTDTDEHGNFAFDFSSHYVSHDLRVDVPTGWTLTTPSGDAHYVETDPSESAGPLVFGAQRSTPVQIQTLSAENSSQPSEEESVSGGSSAALAFTPSVGSNGTGTVMYGRLALNATLSENAPDAFALLKYRVLDELGTVVASGNIGANGVLTGFDLSNTIFADRTVEAWVDADNNGMPNGIESVASLLATSTKFRVANGVTAPIHVGDGQVNLNLSVTIHTGTGKLRITRKIDDKDNLVVINYNAANVNAPVGLLIQGKILEVVIVAQTDTDGTITGP